MLSMLTSLLPNLPNLWILDANPLDCLLQGLIGACGISVLSNLMRVHVFLEAETDESDGGDGSGQKTPRHQSRAKSGLGGTLHFFFLMGLLAVIGSRVASLVVLEFSLRAISAWITTRPPPRSQESKRFLQHLLVQCQFSLGCALSCSLNFLHEGAPQRLPCLLLAAALGWFLARQTARLLHHVVALYKLHSSQRYCCVCIGLLSSGDSLLPMLRRALVFTFVVAVIAAISIINKHFLSATEALRFWTPLTMCYTLLVIYMQEDQQRHPSGQTLLNTVVVRLGGLFILMLTVGRWADVLHILICFLGEAGCLLPTMDLLDVASSSRDEEEDYKENLRREGQRKATNAGTLKLTTPGKNKEH